MLVGDIAIALNLLSIGVLAFAISVLFIAIIGRFTLARAEYFTFAMRKALLWACVTAPWWIAASSMFFFIPSQQPYFGSSWLNDFAHWHHVDLFSYSSWHAITLYCASAYFVWSLVTSIYRRWQQTAALNSALALAQVSAQQSATQQHFYSLPLTTPTAFTAGFLAPKVYISTALQQRLNSNELDIILQHEMAHVAARDPLFKVLFAALARFFPAATAMLLMQQYTLLTEQLADSKVVKHHDSLDVAQTLINVARMQRDNATSHINVMRKTAQLNYFADDHISVRVERLIQPVSASSKPAVGLSCLLLAVIPLLTTSTVDSLHHVIETFFTH